MIPPALSVRQPWASLILAGYKRVENRTWRPGYTGPLVLHAGARLDRTVLPLPEPYAHLPVSTGAYLGRVLLLGVHHAAVCAGGCDLFAEPGAVWHWELARPRWFPCSVAGTGRVGLFPPPKSVVSL